MSMDLEHELNLMLEVYVEGRDDPLTWPMKMHVNDNVTKVSQVMDFAYARINGILDSRSEDHLLIIDPMGHHHLIFRSHMQCLSILAPSQDSSTWGEDEG